MKTDDLIVLGLAALAVFFITKKGGASTGSKPAGWVSEIMNNADPGEPGWGWKYYDNGVVIGPDGSYYKNGQLVRAA